MYNRSGSIAQCPPNAWAGYISYVTPLLLPVTIRQFWNKNGRTGVDRMMEIIGDEIIVANSLPGVPAIDQLDPEYICDTEVVTS